jgi:hypothetical protein
VATPVRGGDAGADEQELARVYASKGQKLPAIEMAQQAVVTAPLNPEARLALVRAVLASGDAARAERERPPRSSERSSRLHPGADPRPHIA